MYLVAKKKFLMATNVDASRPQTATDWNANSSCQYLLKQDLSLKCSAWKSFVFVSIPESLVLSDLVFSP